MPTFERMRPVYEAQLKQCQVLPQWNSAIDRAARRLLANETAYKRVSRATGVPWTFIAALHSRECNGNMRGVLHNGELIVGTGRVTRLVPAGRGPFATWDEAAVDALKMMHFADVKDWSAEHLCYMAEAFNGWGYAAHGVPSAYLWSGTNIYRGGKFVADRVWSGTAWDAQIGVVPLILRLEELAGEYYIRTNSRKLRVLDRARTLVKTVITTVGGAFTLDNGGYLKQWFDLGQGIFSPGVLITLILGGAAAWLLFNLLDKMMLEDASQGRWTPSGAVPPPAQEAQQPTPAAEPEPQPGIGFLPSTPGTLPQPAQVST